MSGKSLNLTFLIIGLFSLSLGYTYINVSLSFLTNYLFYSFSSLIIYYSGYYRAYSYYTTLHLWSLRFLNSFPQVGHVCLLYSLPTLIVGSLTSLIGFYLSILIFGNLGSLTNLDLTTLIFGAFGY